MSKEFKENSQAVQSHLTIYQNVIQRMANNSASSKAWCVTIVSAILVIVSDKEKPQYALIAILPTILFLVLDAYYLALEKGFRNSYNSFIKKLHEGEIEADDLFSISSKGKMLKLFISSLFSVSVLPFYLTLLMMTYLTNHFLI